SLHQSYSCPHTIVFLTYTSTSELYTLSLHDALPISVLMPATAASRPSTELIVEQVTPSPTGSPETWGFTSPGPTRAAWEPASWRSEEHTSELQSRENLVCRLLLEKKNKVTILTRAV